MTIDFQGDNIKETTLKSEGRMNDAANRFVEFGCMFISLDDQ